MWIDQKTLDPLFKMIRNWIIGWVLFWGSISLFLALKASGAI